MAADRTRGWLQANLPKAVYIALTVGGVLFIWTAKTQSWGSSLTIGLPVAFMVGYFLLSAVFAGFRLHDEQAGDNLYYMGFLYTLTSLGVSLYGFNTAESIDGIVRNFGLAVVTTIFGIGLRILYNQVRRDPIDIERSARHELAEMTRRVRVELEAASREFANFRRVSNQMLEEGFEEIGKQAERSGAQILKVMEVLTQEAIKPIRTAGEQIKDMLDDVGSKTEARLSGVTDRMEISTKTFEDANARLSSTLADFGVQVEAAGAKLSAVKTPDELISIKLKPTLTTLEKVVRTHAERLAVTDEASRHQQESLGQTRDAIERLVGAVERSVGAMEQAIEASSRSQLLTEKLGQALDQEHVHLRRSIEKIAAGQAETLGAKIADAVVDRLRPKPATPAIPTDTPVSAPPVEAATAVRHDPAAIQTGDERRFGWFRR